MACPSPSIAAKRWRWWARAAAANPPPHGWCCGCWNRPPAPCGSRHRHPEMTGQPLRKLRRRMQIVFQDPFASLNPRMTVGDILEEPLVVHSIGEPVARRARVNQLLGLVGLASYHAAALSARNSPAASASASASRAHWRWNRPGSVRRAGVRARRVDPGTSRKPAEGSAGAARALLPVHSPTIWRW